MSDYQSIDCNLHDYLEIACMAKVPVSLLTVTGDTLTAVHLNRLTDENKTEWLLYRSGYKSGGKSGCEGVDSRLRLDQIVSLEAVDEDPLL